MRQNALAESIENAPSSSAPTTPPARVNPESLLRHLNGDIGRKVARFQDSNFASWLKPFASRLKIGSILVSTIAALRAIMADARNLFTFTCRISTIGICLNAEAFLRLPGRGDRLHQSIPDLAIATRSEEERIYPFREVRGAIEAWIEEKLGLESGLGDQLE